MKLVITSATKKELIQIKQILSARHKTPTAGFEVLFHESGVGLLPSCFSIAKLIFEKKPQLIVQAGIAGTFNQNIALGRVVTVKDEVLADTGVEENGRFKDLFDLGLQQENTFPFSRRQLLNTHLSYLNYLGLDEVTGVTINEITTRAERIEELKTKYKPVIESMEGAALHYCCLQTSTPFIQIRAVSNFVGERDKTKWNFKVSLENLTSTVVQYIQHVESIQSK